MIEKISILISVFLVLFFLAAGTSGEEVEYKGAGFLPAKIKDPFLPLFPRKAAEVKNVEVKPVIKEEVKPPELMVQGLVWGKITPQAIVNNNVVSLGDTVAGAKIVDINRDGIRILFKDEVFFIRPEMAGKTKKD